MASDNQITIVGNITDDPELRYTANGAAVANFTVAHSTRIRDAAGNWADGDTSFFRVNVWRSLAENAAESLTRGTRVVVTGRLRQRSWENQEGEKRSVDRDRGRRRRSQPEVGHRQRAEDRAFQLVLLGRLGREGRRAGGRFATERGDTAGCRVKEKDHATGPGAPSARRTTRPGRRSRSARSASSARTASSTSTTRTSSRCASSCPSAGRSAPGASRATACSTSVTWLGRQERPRDGPAPVLGAMKIILQKPVEKLGVPGDVVEVADGYARNYLVPRGLAIKAHKGAGRAGRRPPRRPRAASQRPEERVRGARLQADRERTHHGQGPRRRGGQALRLGDGRPDRRRDRRAGRGHASIGRTCTSTSPSARSARTRSRCTCSTTSSRCSRSRWRPRADRAAMDWF